MTDWVEPPTFTHGQKPPASEWNKIPQGLRHVKENQSALGGFFSGSSLSTHHDADKSASQIILRSLEVAVLDNGVGVFDVGPLAADITLAGAGGLDTGAEQASRWYQIWLINNGVNNALLLHLAKTYTEDQTYNSDDATIEVRKSTGTRTALGQGFTTSNSGPIDCVDAELIRVGTVTGYVWAEIRSDDGSGKPTSTVLARSIKLNAANISTSVQRVRFLFDMPYSVTAAEQRHLVITGDWAASDAAYIGWRCDTSSAAYANGTRTQEESAVWNNTGTTDHDFSFWIHVTTDDTEVVMPSGYTGKCLIGWVYNDSASDFHRFHAVNRESIPQKQAVILHSSTVPTLVSLVEHIPPVPVVYRANLLAANISWLLPVPHGFGTPGGTVHRQLGGGAASNATGSRIVYITTQTQAAYAFDTTSTATLHLDSYVW